jgi:hypothetical protein
MSCEKNALLFDRLSVKKVLESYTHIYRFRVYIYLLEFRVISRSSYASSVCSSHTTLVLLRSPVIELR